MKRVKDRIKKLKNAVKNLDIDMVILFDKENVFYFTEFDSGIFFYDIYDTKPTLFVNRMEESRARKSFENVRVIEKLDELLPLLEGRIGINKKGTPLATFEKIKKTKARFLDISERIEEIRAVKSNYEIDCIKKSCSISKKVFKKIENEKLRTELELKGLIEFLITKFKAEPAFPTIIASGKATAIPHHVPTNRKIKKPLLIDFGVRYKGYCSDVTRTFGSRLESTIKDILDKLENELKPGIRASYLDKIFRKEIKNEKFILHELGHGIGVSVHEKPSISKESKDILKPNMVFTLEPAIYAKKGIRIENDYLIRESGFKNLTKF